MRKTEVDIGMHGILYDKLGDVLYSELYNKLCCILRPVWLGELDVELWYYLIKNLHDGLWDELNEDLSLTSDLRF